MVAWLLLLGLPARGAVAQQALVLSGGGARGLAHIGVLEQLSELGYDPDLIIGNSMGAVVGALYAAGYEPAEIRQRTLAFEWNAMFEPTSILLGAARTPRLPMLTFSIGAGPRRIARGLFGDWRINRALVHLLFDANASAQGDFDRLPRRYRAIAADLQTGKKVVLGSGDLARAARASMAIPGFLAPVQWRDRILIDGGIVDNLPTIEARRLGAANIIAVDVSRPRPEPASQDPLAVIQRSLNLMQQNLHPDPVAADILILPLIDAGVGGMAFPDDPVPLIDLGKQAARATLPPLRAQPAGPARSPVAAPVRFTALRVETPDSALAALAREVFASVAPGPYDPAAVLSAVDRLYSTGLFAGIWPHVTGDQTAAGDVTLVVQLDAPARLSLSAGAGFDNDRGGRAWAALERHTAVVHRPVLLSAAASTDGLQRWAALSARMHALARPVVAWSIGAHLHEHSVRTFSEDTRATVEVVRAGGWAGVEFPYILRERVITITGRAEWIDPEDAAGGAALGPHLRVASLPTDGVVVAVPLLLEAEARWGAREYRRVSVAGSIQHVGRSVQGAALIDARITSAGAPVDVLPALGDDHALPGLRWGEMRGRARAVIGVDAAIAVPLGGFARIRVRSGAVGNEPSSWQDARWITGAQVGGIWRVPFGTVEAGYGHATTGDRRFDVSIGRAFQ
jgi:predicted acylesterase/phospholipase RssA